MDELTMALDDLEKVANQEGTAFSYRMASSRLIPVMNALRQRGGDMERVASLIEALAEDAHGKYRMTPSSSGMDGGYRIPDGRAEICTQTRGNGVLTGS